MKKGAIYKVLGLPMSYEGVTFEDTNLSEQKQDAIKEALDNMPDSALLIVTGTAAPIMDYFLKYRNIRGLSFSEVFDYNFKEGELIFPDCDVMFVYGVGDEKAIKKEFPRKVLHRLLKYYHNKGISVVIETSSTASALRTAYDIDVSNKIAIGSKEKKSWI